MIAIRNIWMLSDQVDPSPTITADLLVNDVLSISYWMANWWFVAAAVVIGFVLHLLSYRLDA